MASPPPGCQLFLRNRCHYGASCKYSHAPPPPAALPAATPPSPTSTASSSSSLGSATSAGTSGRRASTPALPALPVRTGAPDCQYYLKTGKCNYGSRCRFSHPFRDERLVSALSRRDCFDFVQTATCPYGRTCKYNHPSPPTAAEPAAAAPWSTSAAPAATPAWPHAAPAAAAAWPPQTVPPPPPPQQQQQQQSAPQSAGSVGSACSTASAWPGDAAVEAVSLGGREGYFVYVPARPAEASALASSAAAAAAVPPPPPLPSFGGAARPASPRDTMRLSWGGGAGEAGGKGYAPFGGGYAGGLFSTGAATWAPPGVVGGGSGGGGGGGGSLFDMLSASQRG